MLSFWLKRFLWSGRVFNWKKTGFLCYQRLSPLGRLQISSGHLRRSGIWTAFPSPRNVMGAGNVGTGRCDLIQGTYLAYSLDCLYLIGEGSDLRTCRKTNDNRVPTAYPTFNWKWFTQCEAARVMSKDYVESHGLPGEKVKKKICLQRVDFSTWSFVSVTHAV